MKLAGCLYHWLAYFYGLREGRYLKPHHVRDGAAFAEHSVAFQRRGFEYGRLIPNGPPTPEEFWTRQAQVNAAREAETERRTENIVAYNQTDDSFLKPGDTVIVPTRPPLDDLYHGDRVRSQPGFTSLEEKVFRLMRSYIDVCSRSHVKLAPDVAARLPAHYANRADIVFRQTKEPWYKQLTRIHGGNRTTFVKASARRTAAYVLSLPRVESLHGADLLVAFGMGGTQTLMLSHYLRRGLAGVFDRPGFTMFEMTAMDEATSSGGLECADRWNMEVVLQMECLQESLPKPKLVRPDGAGLAAKHASSRNH